ncbi:1D-myo-inositol 2-acetamido-2-deoxy-alpha-D-glucopyranoside deacetylase [Deinococcus carri]|uniref:1D-myo-inositol 2-acetamido-2-deoxy-alpha-D-glucopyranoside deacetylase n=1 Tax=Deinococcus carri TaxID=1211323 RepID=A0ABP9W5F0_9DEIO
MSGTASPPLDVPRALVIAAHPDDLESWCGGTVALLADAGVHVHLLLATSGEAGSRDPQDTRQSLRERREAEARRGASLLGIENVTFLRLPDGEVENNRALKIMLIQAIREHCPDVVFTFDPEHPYPPYLSHPDHRAVGRAALDAVAPLARSRLAFEGEPLLAGLAPHRVREVWLFASSVADRAVDIQTTLERKVEARLAHASQTRDAQALRKSWTARSARCGAGYGLTAVEVFKVLELDRRA